MSLLLLARLRQKKTAVNSPGLVNNSTDNTAELQRIKRERLWLFTYIALFTSLLAFFILIISLIELEGSTPKRNYQKLVNILHQESLGYQQQEGLGWLNIENTLTSGIRYTLPANLIASTPLFDSASAQINPRYTPYIRSLSDLLSAMQLEQFSTQHQKLIKGIEAAGYQFKIFIRIEGHTDSNPLAPTARFKNNVELSTFRAYAMMDLLATYTGLPKTYFAIAGYGSFRPIVADTTDGLNRRVEVYLLPQLVLKDPVPAPGQVLREPDTAQSFLP